MTEQNIETFVIPHANHANNALVVVTTCEYLIAVNKCLNIMPPPTCHHPNSNRHHLNPDYLSKPQLPPARL